MSGNRQEYRLRRQGCGKPEETANLQEDIAAMMARKHP